MVKHEVAKEAPASKKSTQKATKDAPASKKAAQKVAPKGKVAKAAPAPAKGSKKSAGSKKPVSKKNSKPAPVKERFFKLVDPETGETSGRYTGKTPKQAASKGYTKRLKKYKEEGKKHPHKSIIYMRESTRGSSKKYYGYSASRIQLAEPQELTIKDKLTGKKKVITYHYRNNIRKVMVPAMIGGVETRVVKAGSKRVAKSSGSKKVSFGNKKAVSKKGSKNVGSKKAVPKKGSKKSTGQAKEE